MKTETRIVFMGTPSFAVASLEYLLNSGCNIVGVVTVPDKPAGRGLQMQESEVKKYAVSKNLKILQPVKLKDPEFISELQELKADLQIVVAFRMLPEVIWKMAPLGTFNLHGSLLPQYRGAAPINWAIINGEKETGITTFFINENIDTGNIIFSEKVTISSDDTAGTLHDKLMRSGAQLVFKTVEAIEKTTYQLIPQQELLHDNIKSAPKIFKADCSINWNDSAIRVYNFIRGLSPYPVAYTEFTSKENKKYLLKVFSSSIAEKPSDLLTGTIVTDGKTYVGIVVMDGLIHITEIQLTGKKKMRIEEFLRGFSMDGISIA